MKRPRLPPVHRFLLALHPAPFRRRWGRAVAWAALRRLAETRRSGRLATARAAWATAWDLFTNLVAAWLDEFASAAGRESEMLESTLRELRLAARRLVNARALTAISIPSLAVAIASAALVFSLLRTVVLHPLPYPEADRLVALWETRAGEDVSVSWPNYRDWAERVRGAELAAFRRTNLNVTGDGSAERLAGLVVTDGLFRVIGVEPALGRSPRQGTPEVALTWALWQGRYGADPGIVGRSLLLDGRSWDVVGVLPPEVRFPDGIVLGSSDLFLSIAEPPEEWDVRDAHPGLYVVGRLAEGATVTTLRSELDAAAAALADAYPETNARSGIAMSPAVAVAAGDLARPLVLLAIAAGLLGLAAIGNVSGLGLADATARRGEWEVRSALGAGRSQLVRQVVFEVAILSAVAASVGLGVAELGARRLPGWGPLARLGLEPGLGAPDVGVGLLVALLGTVLVSLGPLAAALTTAPGTGRATRASAPKRAREGVVVAQVALATVLLVGAGLLGRGLLRIRAEDGGIRPEGVLTFRLSLPDVKYEGEGRTELFYRTLGERLEALPGVTRVGGISTLPFSGSGSQSGILPEGAQGEEPVRTDVSAVLPGGLEALGVEVVHGRLPAEGDPVDGAVEVVVDERLADRFWPGEDPLGRALSGWGFEEMRVVGVIGHVKNYGVTRTSREELYVPHARRPYLSMWMLLRSETPPADLAPAVRRIVAELDPDLPVTGLRVFSDVVDGTISGVLLAVWVGSALALLTAFLAMVGLRGVVAYGVALRTREFGVRLALGDRSASIRRTVLGGTLRLTAVGLVLGGVVAWFASSSLESLVFGVPRADPASWGLAAAVVLAVAAVAGDAPARRAASVDPVSALREG